MQCPNVSNGELAMCVLMLMLGKQLDGEVLLEKVSVLIWKRIEWGAENIEPKWVFCRNSPSICRLVVAFPVAFSFFFHVNPKQIEFPRCIIGGASSCTWLPVRPRDST